MKPIPAFAVAVWLCQLPGASGDEEFWFPDRPGDPFTGPLVPFRPLIEVAPIPTTAPAGGFANADALRDWLTDTVWEFTSHGEIDSLVRLRFLSKGADFTWDGGRCGTKALSATELQLRHSEGHWTQTLSFAADYQSCTFSKGWGGGARLIGRMPKS